ncbi:MAG: class I SAM-dependent methyltransferase [Pseudonocardiaceae bacterium]
MTGPVDIAAFTRFEQDGWSRVPEGYHRFFGPLTGRVADALLDAAAVTAGTRVLDVAAGPGYVAGRAAARGATAVGVDIAEPIVELATRLHPGLEFRCGDAQDLPFADASFTAVVANFLLPHLGDHRRAAAEMTRVLAPGARLAVSTWDVPERVAVLGVIVAAVSEAGATPPGHLPSGPPFFAYSSDDALVGLLRGAGLGEVDVRQLSFTHHIASADELWNGVLGGTVRTSALVASQPRRMQRRIRAAFDRLAGAYTVGDGLQLPVSVKIAVGRR